MPKVLYIDIWDKGLKNFTRIDPSIKKLGAETLLVHIGSFKEKTNYKQKNIDGLTIRDIKFYKTYFLETVIKKEKPDVIIILNLSFLIDRAIINIARKYNIKVVYLAHGKLLEKGLSEEMKIKKNEKIKKNKSKILRAKNALYLLNYLSSVGWSKAPRVLFNILKGIHKDPADFLYFAKFNKELNADKILVYSEEDKDFLIFKGFPQNKIKVIGNPEICVFMKSNSEDKKLFIKNLGITPPFLYAVYLDDGLLQANFISKEDWYRHLIEINNLLNSRNISLVIKLHPRTDIQKDIDFFNKQNIIALKDADFKNLLIHSEFAISMFSSTIVYALLLYKKVLIPSWGVMKDLIIKNYPENLVKYCLSKEDFLKNINYSLRPEDKLNIDKYLGNTNINSIELISNEINNLLILKR